MEHLKVLTVGVFFFLLKISQSHTVYEHPVTSELHENINNEVSKIEKVYTDKLKELRETIRNENVHLKRENNLLIMKLYQERRKSFKQISVLRNEQKDAEKRFMREMKAYQGQTVLELQEKNREIDALKDDIRTIKRALELTSGPSNQNDNEGGNSDLQKAKNSGKELSSLGNTDSLERGELKENCSNGNIGPGVKGHIPYGIHVRKEKHSNKRMLSPASATKVAFFARLTNSTPRLDPNQDIVFDHVVTNVGNGYHGNHGLFVAPVSGIYAISATVMSYLPGPALHINHAKLVKNGQLLARLGQHGIANWDTSSVTILVELLKGDDVAVQNSDYYNMTFWGDNYSTFSGFLLYENVSSPNLVGK